MTTLVFDFDGTISLGTGPVLAYARCLAEQLPVEQAPAFLSEIEEGLAAHPSGQVPDSGAIDGYDLVRLVVARYDADPARLGEAYLASRAHLAAAGAPISAPEGLAEFIRGAKANGARIVLATNAPNIRITEAIVALGLDGLFDAVYTAVGKPAGFEPLLDELLPTGPLLSIGDVWANDLAPVAARGGATALVGTGPDDTSPTFQAENLPELYPAITAWLAAQAPEPAPLPHRTPIATN